MNMRLSLALLPLLLLTACGPKGSTSTGAEASAGGSYSATAGGSSTGHDLTGSPKPLPEIKYPEEFRIQQERIVVFRNGQGGVQRFREELFADGLDEFMLDLTGYVANGHEDFNDPSPDLDLFYEARQRFMVNFRDFHIGDEPRFRENYGMELIPGGFQCAGRDCEKYRIWSNKGLGDVELLVDLNSRMLLGWTLYRDNGGVEASLTTSLLNFDPDFSGFTWSQPAIPEQPYTGPVDDAALGFSPNYAAYLPEGFYSEKSIMLLGEVYASNLPNLHMEVYSDGLRPLLVVQHENPMPRANIGAQGLLTTALRSKAGGVNILEAPDGPLYTFILGRVDRDEQAAVLGSMR